MSLPRASRLQNLFHPALVRPTLVQQRWASTQNQDGKNVEGASGKTPEKAQPKLYSENPPKDEEASQDVKEHNEQMSKRADKPSEKVKDEDVENDKVNKGFWSGM